jgi:hypothetical protein
MLLWKNKDGLEKKSTFNLLKYVLTEYQSPGESLIFDRYTKYSAHSKWSDFWMVIFWTLYESGFWKVTKWPTIQNWTGRFLTTSLDCLNIKNILLQSFY